MAHTDARVCGAYLCSDSLADLVVVQKIKKDLIRKAQVKKSYSKIKEREQFAPSKTLIYDAELESEAAASLELHPDRQAMLDEPEQPAATLKQTGSEPKKRRPHPKPVPFQKEALLAQQRREERERRQREIEESRKQREAKIEERERFRRAMAKARSGGRDGQRKLGRESKVLLEKVQKMMNT